MWGMHQTYQDHSSGGRDRKAGQAATARPKPSLCWQIAIKGLKGTHTLWAVTHSLDHHVFACAGRNQCPSVALVIYCGCACTRCAWTRGTIVFACKGNAVAFLVAFSGGLGGNAGYSCGDCGCNDDGF